MDLLNVLKTEYNESLKTFNYSFKKESLYLSPFCESCSTLNDG